MVVRTFGPQAGGRTRAGLDRAAVLAEAGVPCRVMTLDHQIDYARTFESWRARLSLPDDVRPANLFEHVAGETLYDAGPSVAFDPSQPLVHPEAEDSRHRLRRDGSLLEVVHTRAGVVLRVDRHDRQGRPRVLVASSPDGSDGTRTTFLTQDGRAYLVEDHGDGRPGRCVVHDAGGSRTYADRQELARAWVADLHAADPGVVFVCDDRRSDDVVVQNPLAPDVTSVAVVHTSHLAGDNRDVHRVAPYNDAVLRCASAFTAVVLLTHDQADDVVTHYGPTPNLHVIPHAAVPRRPRVRRDRWTVVTVSRVVRAKRIHHLLEAVALVRDDLPRLRLRVHGVGDERAGLVERAGELGLDGVVSFPGYTEKPADAMAAGAVMVSTSRIEGFGLSILEALACGTPVIAYDAKYGPRELVTHGHNGFLVPDGDVEALAAALRRFFAHPWRARLMSRRARRSTRAFSRAALQQRWLALLDQLAEERSSRRP